jgi:transposase
VARSKNGEAISLARRTPKQVAMLRAFLVDAERRGDLDEWRRAKAVLGYLDGSKAAVMARAFDVARSSINLWLRWYETLGVEGLRTKKAPGAPPRLTQAQRDELARVIEEGPQNAGFSSGMWTGPMIGDWIERTFGVHYHKQHVPRLLHQMGFSVQRPRKRLARADAEAQAIWLRERFPAIKKKRPAAAAS